MRHPQENRTNCNICSRFVMTMYHYSFNANSTHLLQIEPTPTLSGMSCSSVPSWNSGFSNNMLFPTLPGGYITSNKGWITTNKMFIKIITYLFYFKPISSVTTTKNKCIPYILIETNSRFYQSINGLDLDMHVSSNNIFSLRQKMFKDRSTLNPRKYLN